ncbi:cold-shock protein [Catellatospora bangladeshensis]|uniref:Cold-shock protein CspA n=1 Tax=Catellatospora bangladeshensis TaxID=310355 RepID=A0A8J3JRH5_9ACTN|nr:MULTISPECIES: cold-shock protein [Catellatospora]BCJ72154.1 cold-shock protein CspA [Catellatospora sp. IY07-71]GIF82489.1 cold-shock protein CspA [Catellatospora bangladeshensis]
MPTGRVKWYDTEKGFGFLTRDDGGDVFVHKAALPNGVGELKPGQKVEFGVAAGRKGDQALQVQLIDAPPSLQELRRRPAEDLNDMIEDMIKVLEARILPDLKRGRYPEKKGAQKIAEALHAIARELEI